MIVLNVCMLYSNAGQYNEYILYHDIFFCHDTVWQLEIIIMMELI